MQLIQPTLPIMPLRPATKAASQETNQSSFAPPSTTPQNTTEQETGSKAIQPAAPPSVLQLQIKALISQQAEHLQDQPSPKPEDPS